MKYQPEILRGQPYHESPYVHFGKNYFRLHPIVQTNAIMTFKEGSQEYIFDIPVQMLSSLERGEYAPISLKWLVTVSPNRLKSVPRLPAIKDSDDLN